jgi:hypothetical protein
MKKKQNPGTVDRYVQGPLKIGLRYTFHLLNKKTHRGTFVRMEGRGELRSIMLDDADTNGVAQHGDLFFPSRWVTNITQYGVGPNDDVATDINSFL